MDNDAVGDIQSQVCKEAAKTERERILALIEEELESWREMARMGNTLSG
jgi:hypothetical protein